MTNANQLATLVLGGDRRALARAITLVESTRTDHRDQARALVDAVLESTGGAMRLGISGPPGVGKSTFIEAFGIRLTEQGHRVAVLAVDPTSTRSGGSILGDKTRMERLSNQPNAFVRPSPSGRELGGVARRSREAVLLCEAAGFDVVLVETVGVGQSEVAVAGLTDLFVLLASPTGGDDLQGIKRGIMELADLVIVTKADGALEATARHACSDIRNALHLLRPPHPELSPEVMLVSSTAGTGIAEAWDRLKGTHSALADAGALDRLRAEQARQWMWSELQDGLLDLLRADRRVAEHLPELEAEVAAGMVSPATAAHRLLATLT